MTQELATFGLVNIAASPVRLFLVLAFLASFLPFAGSSYYRTATWQEKKPPVRYLPIQLPPMADLPEKLPKSFSAPGTSAMSVFIKDASSQTVLYQKSPDEKLLPASTTKMLTALVVLDNCTLDQVLEVSSPPTGPQDSLMGLKKGEKVTVANLLYGLLLASGNDAAYTLADNCSNQNEDFIESMNQKAQALGMKNSHFTNPAGVDTPDHYSTAYDLSILGQVVIEDSVLSEVVATKHKVATDIDGQHVYRLENRNSLLGTVAGVSGIKTGYTQNAKECIVISAKRDGHTIIVTLMGSQDRVTEATQLVDWVFDSFQWNQLWF
ncbi:D-alanyl-D-alanine carboxypeptidase [Candidatus Daviesbacteria bacterium]|nr:D-alanyl-D-alanine carboxypeptidase [Candidatus Daviesbacteria bacterium]